jgi:intracellular sulfur oxidation DsrE/DsrF family protein
MRPNSFGRNNFVIILEFGAGFSDMDRMLNSIRWSLPTRLNCMFIIQIIVVITNTVAEPLPEPAKPFSAEAYGWVVVPDAALMPDKQHTYRAIFSATKGASSVTELIPAINFTATELNALIAAGATTGNANFVIDFHGTDADVGLLDNLHYKAKYGVDNPNLKVLSELKGAGVKLFVCSQQLLADHVDFKSLTPDVTIASDGLIVLMTFQNQGYAFLPF